MPLALQFQSAFKGFVAGLAPGVLAAIVLVAALAWAPTAQADTIAVKFAELRADDDAYVLNAEFDLAVNATLEEALQKGVPLYFVFEFELLRPRWYWLDEKSLSISTQYRVSYNALTRQYRLASGLLGQTFEGIDEVERSCRASPRAGLPAAQTWPREPATKPRCGYGSMSTRCRSPSR